MDKCTKCGNPLSRAEIFSHNNICDSCLLQERIRNNKKELMLKNIEDNIPPEYRGNKSVDAIISRLNTEGINHNIWETNIYITGTRGKMVKMKWSIAEYVWRNTHSAKVINFLPWSQEYSCLGQDKWLSMLELISFDGYLIIDSDSLYCDQQLLYTIMQSRQDQGRYMCLITSFAKSDESARALSSYIASFIGDKTNKYYCFDTH